MTPAYTQDLPPQLFRFTLFAAAGSLTAYWLGATDLNCMLVGASILLLGLFRLWLTYNITLTLTHTALVRSRGFKPETISYSAFKKVTVVLNRLGEPSYFILLVFCTPTKLLRLVILANYKNMPGLKSDLEAKLQTTQTPVLTKQTYTPSALYNFLFYVLVFCGVQIQHPNASYYLQLAVPLLCLSLGILILRELGTLSKRRWWILLAVLWFIAAADTAALLVSGYDVLSLSK